LTDITVPRWVVVTGHLAAICAVALIVLVAVLSYQNLRTSREAVTQLQNLNTFFTETLITAQRRADSLRAVQRRQIDSLRNRGRQ
jgi:hypothetical protein